MAWCRILQSEKNNVKRTSFHVGGAEIVFGRSRSCDVRLIERVLSQKQFMICKMYCDEEKSKYRVMLKDTSRHGTRVNGVDVGKDKMVFLKHKDKITMRGSMLEYTYIDVNEALNVENVGVEDQFEMSVMATVDLDDDDIDLEVNQPPMKRVKKTAKMKKSGGVGATEANVSNATSTSTSTTTAISTITEKTVDEKYLEELTCGICCELCYRAVSLLPCMHTFCAACESEWLKSNRTCPECRMQLTGISRNRTIDNLVAVYLTTHPEKQRTQAEMDNMDAANTIGDGVDFTKKSSSKAKKTYTGSSFNLASGSVSFSSGAQMLGGSLSLVAAALGSAGVLNHTSCRECRAAGRDGHQCSVASGDRHLVCSACTNRFPDRSPSSGAVTCTCASCSRSFCEPYWAANGHARQMSAAAVSYAQRCSSGNGALHKCEDHSLAALAARVSVLNRHETEVMLAYARDQSLSPLSIIAAVRNDSGRQSTLRTFDLSKIVCSECAVKELSRVYVYYAVHLMDRTLLPANEQLRADCWYGVQCRTQHHNQSHARRYNHLCEKKAEAGQQQSQ